jgi:hypothetical protein
VTFDLKVIFWQDFVIVSQQALEAWTSRHLVKSSQDKLSITAAGASQGFPTPQTTVMSDILCEHNRLDPMKATNMKRISQVGLPLHSCMFTHLVNNLR